MRAYLAGPMTGIPSFNFPAFDEAAHDLRARGYTIFSPAEMDDDDTRLAAMASPDGSPGSGSSNGETWGSFLARDIMIIAGDECDGVIALPGWEKSKGATFETEVARRLGKPIYSYPDLEPIDEKKVKIAQVAAGWY